VPCASSVRLDAGTCARAVRLPGGHRRRPRRCPRGRVRPESARADNQRQIQNRSSVSPGPPPRPTCACTPLAVADRPTGTGRVDQTMIETAALLGRSQFRGGTAVAWPGPLPAGPSWHGRFIDRSVQLSDLPPAERDLPASGEPGERHIGASCVAMGAHVRSGSPILAQRGRWAGGRPSHPSSTQRVEAQRRARPRSERCRAGQRAVSLGWSRICAGRQGHASSSHARTVVASSASRSARSARTQLCTWTSLPVRSSG
jgi:hypothetical protein